MGDSRPSGVNNSYRPRRETMIKFTYGLSVVVQFQTYNFTSINCSLKPTETIMWDYSLYN